jgi:hypothetical protein
MNITHLVYIGTLGSKTVSGVGEFKKGEPLPVPPHKVKSILNHWPGQFAAVITETAESTQLKGDYEKACETIAAMHAAAVGEVTGPVLGVVEDVKAVRNELLELRNQNTALEKANVRLTAHITDLEARVAALLAGEQTPPPKIDPANPLDKPEAKQVTDAPTADTPPQDPPADAPKRGRPPKSASTDAPKE